MIPGSPTKDIGTKCFGLKLRRFNMLTMRELLGEHGWVVVTLCALRIILNVVGRLSWSGINHLLVMFNINFRPIIKSWSFFRGVNCSLSIGSLARKMELKQEVNELLGCK